MGDSREWSRWRKGAVIICLLLASVATACQLEKKTEAPRFSFERVAIAYHGMLLDNELREIPLDASSIEDMQDSMLESLLREGDEPTKARNKELVDGALHSLDLKVDERLLIKIGVAGKLIDQLPYETTHVKYGWRYKLIRQRLYELVDIRVLDDLPSGTISVITKYGLWDYIRPQRFLDQYIADCAAQSVPIPPDWGDASWKFRGILDPAIDFVGGDPTKVYTFNNASGVCFALPRGGSRKLMGIICQSEQTGKACFWDNIDSATNQRIDWESPPIEIAKLQNGMNLKENCTMCHRGKNVFLIHPGTALEVPTIDTDPAIWYSPIAQIGWRNGQPLSNPNLSRCVTCHQLPQVTQNYCWTVARNAANKTMPPGSPAGWEAPSGGYASAVNALKSTCDTASSPTCSQCH